MTLATLLLAAALAGSPAVTYVDANLASGANDGSSWANAYRGPLGLKAALDAGATTIWVADGVYHPGPAGSPSSTTFSLTGNPVIIGGFAGGERFESQANPSVNVAILSGDLPGGPAGQAELETIMTISDAQEWLTIQGLTFDVSVSGPAHGASGTRRALAIDDSAGVIIKRCAFKDGQAEKGGAVLVTDSSANFIECSFENNLASTAGGAVFSDRTSESYFVDCSFTGNSGGLGAGIYFGAFGAESVGGAFPSLRGCTFSGNVGMIGAASGGAIYCRSIIGEIVDCTFEKCVAVGGGGGIFSQNSNLSIDRCRFLACAAPGDGGGAIYANNTGPIGWQTTDITNCLFSGNHNALFAANGAFIEAEHCTIANSHAQPGQPLFFPTIVATGGQPSKITLRNSILWGNAAFAGAPVGGNVLALAGSTVKLDRCDAQGWSGPIGNVSGTGSFSADPHFVDNDGVDAILGTADDDLRLGLTSPCIDAADTNIIEFEFFWSFDLAENERPFDVPTTANTGVGSFTYSDIGCLERSPSDCPFDLTLDGVVDAADLAFFLGEWDAWGSPADFDHDEIVGAGDLAMLLGAFGAQCP